MLQKFSKYEVKAVWCGNFTILLPLKFHVKSSFGKNRMSKNAILIVLETFTLNFSHFLSIEKLHICIYLPKAKFRTSQIAKNHIFYYFNSPKDFT